MSKLVIYFIQNLKKFSDQKINFPLKNDLKIKFKH
jgi:hypothetical protein